ncbi:hypothetical protein [Parvularcula dongshanensis]|uniref:Uncharacterized protein n=1 Tax=Parvularcula dongshanensis TaxID=1173995 RepID=A0A840I1Q3_9PROT|nr:hypothetical protein [Parvularcula dongshanensis]MBB4658275.1 hypothetical protein [Parvularcula dongshanensis]
MTAADEAASDAADLTEGEPRSRRMRAALTTGSVVFGILTVTLIVAAYRFGEGVVYIDGRTISDLSFLEVTGGAAAGAAGVLVGLGAALVGLVAAVLATVLSLALATVGVGFGLFLTLGVVTGPILLAVIIGVLIKRRYWPDVI